MKTKYTYFSIKNPLIRITEDCNCRKGAMRPEKNLCCQPFCYSGSVKEIYLEWENGKTKQWWDQKWEKAQEYYVDDLPEYRLEYNEWLENSLILKELKEISWKQLTNMEMIEIKNKYILEEYNKTFLALSYKEYKKKYMYITNPYIGYHLENLWVLACLEIPWNVKIWPGL